MALKIQGLETYYGGKNGPGVYQTIINQIPPHTTYIEPFLGSGAVMRHKRLAQFNYGSDLDPRVIKLWKVANPKHIQLHCIGWLQAIDQPLQGETFVYCDPPYPLLSRETKRKTYRFEMTDQEHIEFVKQLGRFECMVCVSSYDNPIYNEWLKGWRKVEFTARTRKGNATEVLYMNYPEPTALHDYSFYGDTKRKRQDFRKKIAGYKQKFLQMDPLERSGILSALLDPANEEKHT